jgi:DNA mismatch repair protein MutL
MFPYLLTLKPAEYDMVEQCLPLIRSLGFEADEFGDNTIKISSVPMLLSNINIEEFFANFLDEARANPNFKQSDVIKDKLMQHSCKSAIKGGNNLSQSEIESLFRGMGEEKIPLFCPHGRPIAVRVTKTEIEKWFKRIV